MDNNKKSVVNADVNNNTQKEGVDMDNKVDTYGLSDVNVLDTINNLEGGNSMVRDTNEQVELFMRKFCRETAREHFKVFLSDLAAAGLTVQKALELKEGESQWKPLLAIYRKVKLYELHRMRVEIAETRADVNRVFDEVDALMDKGVPYEKAVDIQNNRAHGQKVTIVNCILSYKDDAGNDRKDFIENETVTRKQFDRVILEGRLVAAKPEVRELVVTDSNGRVSFNEQGEVVTRMTELPIVQPQVIGYTDLMDIDIEDFNSTDEITIEHGSGIVEIIDRDWYLETITRGLGATETVRYLNDAEIKYGNAQEGFGAEHAEYRNAMFELFKERTASASSVEYKAYVAEQLEERKKAAITEDVIAMQGRNFNSLKEAIVGATSVVQLNTIAAGKLFPKSETFNGIEVKGVWVWTMNAVSRIQRQELMALYRNQFKSFIRKSAFTKLLEVEGKQNGMAEITRQDARNIIAYAQDERRRTGNNLLSLQKYYELRAIANRAA